MLNKNNGRGLFITLEGTEGVGKTTNKEFIANEIREAGIELVVTREPGGTPFAEEIRDLLLANRSEKVHDTAELLLVFAARAQHLETLIKPALNAGKWVLSDRFTDATYAYQGAGRGMNLHTIASLESLVQGAIRPDCTFLLDIDVEVGMRRARSRGDLDRFENEADTFFEKVREGYHRRVSEYPDRYRVVDAGRSLESVQSDIKAQLTSLLEKWA